MSLTKKFFCPVHAWNCPYHKEDGSCSIVDDGDDPIKECEDVSVFWDETKPDYFVWEDENGKLYEVIDLLEMGYHFVNNEPVLGLEDTMKIVAEILKSPPMGMKTIEIRRPN